jgi:ATP-binding cassette, subfamily B, bacterial MsbA
MSKPVVSPGNGWPIYKRLLGYTRPYWHLSVLSLVASVLYSLLDAGTIKLLQPMIDMGFVTRDPHVVWIIPIIIVVIFLLRGVASFMSDYCTTTVGRRIVMTLRQQMFSHLLRMPAAFYDESTSGQLLSKIIFNVEQVSRSCTTVIADTVRQGCSIIGLIAVMFSNSWRLTCIFMIGIPVMAGLFHYASRRFRRLGHEIQHTIASVTHVAEENIEGYKVVKIFGGEAYESAQFNQATKRHRQLEMKSAVTDAASAPIIQFFGGCGLALATFFAMQQGSHALSAGQFTSLVVAMIALLRPIKQLTSANNDVQRGIAGAYSIFELIDKPTETDTGTKVLTRAQGTIEYRSVGFHYKTDHNKILHNIHFTIQPGETIAFVGHSGGGKTTLVNLLARFYDHYQGTILLDNIDIRDIKLASLRQQMALVSQQVTLFNDTISHNIAYGEMSHPNEAAIRAAAEAAYALDFIENLPEGFNTRVGENGVLLSGGQRQRIAIARALYKNAPILILDEATSALDTASELIIQKALESLMKNRTTLVVAHRLSTIEKADRIFVVHAGCIVETGTHAQLLAAGGHYAELYALQFKAKGLPT